MPSEAVLYTTFAAVHRYREDLVIDSLAEHGEPAAAVEATRSRKIQPPCVWQPMSGGGWARVHIFAEIDQHTSEARFRIVVWILESGVVVVDDVLGVGCSWWQSACDGRAFRRLEGVNNHTYGFMFRSSTKATECSRIMDHILADSRGMLKVVKKLTRANVDLQSLVMAWQGVGLHLIHYLPRTPRIHSETTSSSLSSPCPELIVDRRITMYPRGHEASSLWHEGQHQEDGNARVLRTPTDTDSNATTSRGSTDCQAAFGPKYASLAEDEDDINEMSNGAPISPVALLETGGATEAEARFGFAEKRLRGEWISCPYKNRGKST